MYVSLDDRAVQIQEHRKVDDVATRIYLYRKFMGPTVEPFEKVRLWLRDAQSFLQDYLECDSQKVMIDVDNVPQSPRILAKKLGEILDVRIDEPLQIGKLQDDDLWSSVYHRFLRATPTSGEFWPTLMTA